MLTVKLLRRKKEWEANATTGGGGRVNINKGKGQIVIWGFLGGSFRVDGGDWMIGFPLETNRAKCERREYRLRQGP